MSLRIGGKIYLKIDGELLRAKGAFTYGLGKPHRESVIGADGTIQGYKEAGTVPFIEGEITDHIDFSMESLADLTDSTVTLELANGKSMVLSSAFSVNNDGLTGQTEEGNIPVRFEGEDMQEIK